MVTPAGFTALIFNPVEIDAAILPFELTRNFTVDRATSEEVKHIKNILPQLSGNSDDVFAYFESECDRQSLIVESLPSDQWKYYVVRTKQESNCGIVLLDSICNIASLHLDVSSLTWKGTSINASKPNIILHKISSSTRWQRQRISSKQLAEIAELYTLHQSVVGTLVNSPVSAAYSITQIDSPFPEINRALEMLGNLDFLPTWSELLVLGLFSIIEMLITHNPKLEDRGDSITHQLKGKVPLLERRFDRRLPYTEYFGQASSDKVWAALYKYRSAIAHGGQLDFDKGQLAVIKSKEVADKFLFEVVRGMLRHILREPHLYADLREC